MPIRTPFALTGSGADADGDALVYLWEQTDFGERHRSLSDNTKVHGPLFRVFGDDAVVSDEDSLKSPSPGHQHRRRQPDPGLPGHGAGARRQHQRRDRRLPGARRRRSTGQLPDQLLDCYSEFLPDTDYLGSLGVDDRTMDFRLTARDLSANGGGARLRRRHADASTRRRARSW